MLGVARRRGWRLNLRPLAEVQTLAWLLGLALVVRWLCALLSSDGGLFVLDKADQEYYAELHRVEQQRRMAAVAEAAWQELDGGGV